jgi:hypothetical protein
MESEQKKYFAARSETPEETARVLRMRRRNANVYQHHFIIVGPEAQNPFLPHMTVYAATYYEDCLMALLKGENHTVPPPPPSF